jgi:two-component system, chemotaxis family, protein-glutamate methylesterase/glutaminase
MTVRPRSTAPRDDAAVLRPAAAAADSPAAAPSTSLPTPGDSQIGTHEQERSRPASRGEEAQRRPAGADDDFRVVCLGGSAGGLQGYQDILRNLPADTGMAFVIAPHRQLKGADVLLHLLSSVTAMPVREVAQGMRLEPNRVFVMPPHMDLTTDGRAFQLQTISRPPGWPKTISIFLRSLAEVCGRRAVAVILSGLDHDGAAALKVIKDAGGVTFAQSDASQDAMPRHAVATGHIDYLLPAAEIAKGLLVLAHERNRPQDAPLADGGDHRPHRGATPDAAPPS